jgi:hypothetical protein
LYSFYYSKRVAIDSTNDVTDFCAFINTFCGTYLCPVVSTIYISKQYTYCNSIECSIEFTIFCSLIVAFINAFENTN